MAFSFHHVSFLLTATRILVISSIFIIGVSCTVPSSIAATEPPEPVPSAGGSGDRVPLLGGPLRGGAERVVRRPERALPSSCPTSCPTTSLPTPCPTGVEVIPTSPTALPQTPAVGDVGTLPPKFLDRLPPPRSPNCALWTGGYGLIPYALAQEKTVLQSVLSHPDFAVFGSDHLRDWDATSMHFLEYFCEGEVTLYINQQSAVWTRLSSTLEDTTVLFELDSLARTEAIESVRVVGVYGYTGNMEAGDLEREFGIVYEGEEGVGNLWEELCAGKLDPEKIRVAEASSGAGREGAAAANKGLSKKASCPAGSLLGENGGEAASPSPKRFVHSEEDLARIDLRDYRRQNHHSSSRGVKMDSLKETILVAIYQHAARVADMAPLQKALPSISLQKTIPPLPYERIAYFAALGWSGPSYGDIYQGVVEKAKDLARHLKVNRLDNLGKVFGDPEKRALTCGYLEHVCGSEVDLDVFADHVVVKNGGGVGFRLFQDGRKENWPTREKSRTAATLHRIDALRASRYSVCHRTQLVLAQPFTPFEWWERHCKTVAGWGNVWNKPVWVPDDLRIAESSVRFPDVFAVRNYNHADDPKGKVLVLPKMPVFSAEMLADVEMIEREGEGGPPIGVVEEFLGAQREPRFRVSVQSLLQQMQDFGRRVSRCSEAGGQHAGKKIIRDISAVFR